MSTTYRKTIAARLMALTGVAFAVVAAIAPLALAYPPNPC